MTDDERRSLAEQILNNPLFAEVFEKLEKSATERLIYEDTDTLRAQIRVQEVRSFRAELEHALETPTRRGAPA